MSDSSLIISPRQITDPRSRWYQDREVTELIEHMDHPDRYENWDSLTRSELAAIESEIQRCRKDFVYAARNYFWVIDDRGNERPFCLWPSQEIIYDTLCQIRAKGMEQRVVIVKSRRLGCSTLIEGLVAWSTIFFANRVGIVVSYDRDHTKSLLGIMLYIYDRLPWWIKPRVLSRTFESGLIFDNPDHETRRQDPGTGSRVMLKSGNAITGVGQGFRISAAHLSEFADFDDWRARNIIEEDLKYAIQPGKDSFAFLESTAKGANRYAHKFWKRCEDLAEKSEWFPLFLPWFVDKTHVMMATQNQIFDPELHQMRERIKDEWVQCDYKPCERYFNRWKQRVDQAGEVCTSCNTGKLQELILTDDQLAWMQLRRLNAKDDEESSKRLLQEQACVVGETRVSTESGIIRIDAATNSEYTECGPIDRWYDNGERDVVVVKTKMGRELTCTPDHRFFLSSGEEVEASLLQVGSVLVLSRPRLADGYFSARMPFAGRTALATTIDEEWGLLLGYFMGDGSWGGNGIRFTIDEKDQDVAQDISRVCEAIIGAPSRISKSNQYKAFIVESSWKDWDRILTGLGCLRRRESDRGIIRNVCVPECIFRSPIGVIRKFLAALFECDGHGYRDSPRATLFTKYPDFARDVQLLLLACGINAQIKEENKKSAFGNDYPYIGRSIQVKAVASQVFYRDIGFIGKRKRESSCIRAPYINTTFKNEMADTIESVTPCGKRRVFDLNIRDTHKFGANGLLVHNSTAEESFQVSGYQVFGKKAQNFAAAQVRNPILTGFIDNFGAIHAVDPDWVKFDANGNPIPDTIRCIIEGCRENHYLDTCPLRIWETPEAGAKYYIGVDVSEGLGGNCDYSVASVIKLSRGGLGQTYQVAVWRSNTINPQDFAEQLNFLGHIYNTCEISVEVNRFDTTSTWLRMNCQYPYLYRWKHIDSLNIMSNKIGWFTNQISRPRLHQNFRRFLEYEMFFVRSRITAEEMKNFVKDDYDDRTAGADSDSHDDELIATMIALWCAYEGEYDETRGFIPLNREPNQENSEYKFECQVCNHVFFGDRSKIPEEGDFKNQMKCPKCNSIRVQLSVNRVVKVFNPQETIGERMERELFGRNPSSRVPDIEYWQL